MQGLGGQSRECERIGDRGKQGDGDDKRLGEWGSKRTMYSKETMRHGRGKR